MNYDLLIKNGIVVTEQKIIDADVYVKDGIIAKILIRDGSPRLERFNGLAAGPIHDATCIGYLVDPGCIELHDMHVVIDTNEGPCYGRTVCDEVGVMKGRVRANAKVGMAIDTARFFDLVEECIRMYD